ncbi:hypothetical protein ATO12_14550 [Aquimarina atlantica]|uniref:Uncharacterized protein n=1 Tax=Aquimarina atlantica TaxID=1317122 RepID=A0A023BVP3_9FLAO|nr:hypothetical protein ATO12_14550 [Aquimarina atlantica]
MFGNVLQQRYIADSTDYKSALSSFSKIIHFTPMAQICNLCYRAKKAILDSSAEPFDKLRTGLAELHFVFISLRQNTRIDAFLFFR